MRKKIGALAGVLIALSAVQGTVAMMNLHSSDKINATLAQNAMPGLEAVGLIRASFYQFRGDAWKHMTSTNPAQMASIEQQQQVIRDEFERQTAAYEKTITEPQDRANFQKMRSAADAYFSGWLTVVPVSRAGKNEEAFGLYMTRLDPHFREMQGALASIQERRRELAHRAVDEILANSNASRLWTWGVMLVSLVVAVVLSWMMIQGLNRTLRRAIQSLDEGARQITMAATQMADSAQSLAAGASEQAASLEETSASSEQVNAMARRNVENAREAATVVTQSHQSLGETNTKLEQMVAAMEEINTQAVKISKIIKVIDEIAFQTNLLALNAAVEAARAGDAGMGFAVVADEVRSLAKRCADAARDTTELIEGSISKASEGRRKLDEVASAVRVTAGEVSQIKRLVDEVNSGSQQQTQGFEQVLRAVAQIEKVTQQSAAGAEQGAAAAEELKAQSGGLQEVVGSLVGLVDG